MTAPEPTAVERTIAEAACRAMVEPEHWDDSCMPCAGCWEQARAVVAAIRNLPPEQQAELIGRRPAGDARCGGTW